MRSNNGLSHKLAKINFKDQDWASKLRQDNIFPTVETKPTSELAGFPTVDRLTKAIIVDGKIVHFASDNYNLLKNEDFFIKAEEKLIEQEIYYAQRTTNKNNCAFAADYILNDPKHAVVIKSNDDVIRPMLRLINSYDGSNSVFGSFGFYRQVCSNGLQVSKSIVDFKIRHKKNVTEIVMPNLSELIVKFMDNEFYSINKVFQTLAETPVLDLEEYVQYIVGETNLFKFFKGDDEEKAVLSASTEKVMDIVNREAKLLGTLPNLWLGYNAFNEYINESGHGLAKLGKLDRQIFDLTTEFK
jgi:hypothetical protein